MGNSIFEPRIRNSVLRWSWRRNLCCCGATGKVSWRYQDENGILSRSYLSKIQCLINTLVNVTYRWYLSKITHVWVCECPGGILNTFFSIPLLQTTTEQLEHFQCSCT